MTTSAEEKAVLAVLNAETEAWLRRDLTALAEHWLHSPQARRMVSIAKLGIQVQQGWDAILAKLVELAEKYPDKFAEDSIRRENMNIVVDGNMAWVSYDQVGIKSDDKFLMAGTQHELKIFQRINGIWKIACLVVMMRTIDHEICPLIEIDLDKKILWMNDQGQQRLSDHPALLITGGHLRLRNQVHQAAFDDAVTWANSMFKSNLLQRLSGRLSRAVVLGESDSATPILCWLLIEDGKLLVSFDDEQRLKRRLMIARDLYKLTTAQAQLAELLALGSDLKMASQKLGVTINTVKTHLQRMYDKTGVRSQSALVAMLFSAEAPT